MSDSTIKILVLIPVYNAAKYLKKCLDSVLNQSYPNWEAFVIDDASTDESYQLLEKYAAKDKRINIYRQVVNQGPGITRNEAIKYAYENANQLCNSSKVGYIVFLDSDDWIDKDYFQSIAEVANKEKADIIFVDLIQEKESGDFIKHERMSAYKNKSKDTIIRHQMTGKFPWGGVRKAVKIDLVIINNIKFTNDAIGEEAIYSFKLLYLAKKIGFIERSLYHYVIHQNSQSGLHDDNPYGRVCTKMEEYLREINVYDQYKNTIASFAFTALIVSIYRSSQYYAFYKVIKQSYFALRKYRHNYGFNLDKDSLEMRTRCILPFAKLNLVFPIVLIAKIKASFKK
jgi:glycosyltransferase involved in cell wall biosynthesis